jgi:cytochrome oxidase Cu insertion factor (SCO1/SenC/PrrC family)
VIRCRVMFTRWLVVVAAVVLGGVVLPAQTDIASLGPQVGQRAIDFSLPDQNGRLVTLKSIAGPKGTMLVFFRSADW